MRLKNDKDARRELLRKKIEFEPLLTDDELAAIFSVSVQTIRLDRAALSIPEVRERVRRIATESKVELHETIRLNHDMGELLELNISKYAMAMLEITAQMIEGKNTIESGYCLYKQAIALSLAVLNAPSAYLAEVNLKFLHSIAIGDKIFARAECAGNIDNIFRVKVTGLRNAEEVFRAKFLMLL